MIRVKICGVATLPDAMAAVRAGADAVGFLVGPVHPTTSRFITAEAAGEIVAGLPPFCSPVLVTHLPDADAIVAAARVARVTTIQLHGDCVPDTARRLRHDLPGVKVLTVLHVAAGVTAERARPWGDVVDGFVFDTADAATGQVGGTGRTHDWGLSRALREAIPKPVILAGGLRPENVAAAVRAVRPFAVDVNSGVSRPDGSKDPERMEAFVRAVRGVGPDDRA
jgi:phosphoribosylanthranilate isomerase